MTQTNPFASMLQAMEAPPVSVVNKALAAFAQTEFSVENRLADPTRTRALLEKIFGEDIQYVRIKNPENLPEFATFVIDGIELAFWQGTTPEEDLFELLDAGVPFPTYAIRSLTGLGEALAAAASLDKLIW